MNCSRTIRRHLLALTALLTLATSGCARYSEATSRRPVFAGAATPVGQEIIRTQKWRKGSPEEKAGRYLDAVKDAVTVLEREPGNADALRAYNFALSRVFGELHAGGRDLWSVTTLPGRAGAWTLATSWDSRPGYRPALTQCQPADEYEFKGTYVTTRSLKPGLGAPLIFTSRQDEDFLARDRFAQGKHVFYGMTVVARFTGQRVEVAFEDPLETESVRLGRQRFPLAADFTAPIALALATDNPRKLELARLIWPGKYEDTTRLARLQPYDPAKIPVICVHGLMDSPATWSPLIMTLRGDAEIRKRYQFWFFSYPSGYPYPYSAALFRHQLDEIRKVYPDHKKAVLIGHSMGGMISRAAVTDSGNSLWKLYSDSPPEKSGLEREARQYLRDSLIFESRHDVSRVIFISAPHRGSDLASNWLGRLGARLIRAPADFFRAGQQIRNVLTLNGSAVQLDRMPNSVDTLSPRNRFVEGINQLPIDPAIPYHSIIGDRGKGDTPASSDGFVPYWSSHLEGAQSELIVPSGHSAHQNPEAIAEVARILKQHVR